MIYSHDSAVGREEEMDRLRVMYKVSSIPNGNNNFKTFNKTYSFDDNVYSVSHTPAPIYTYICFVKSKKKYFVNVGIRSHVPPGAAATELL